MRARDTRNAVAEIERYIRRKNPELESVAQGLRALVRKLVPKSKESLNPWGIPTLESAGPFCYFMVGKDHVTLGFHRGTSLPDPEGLLEGTGKNLRHVKLRSIEDLERKGLIELMRSAARLNGEETQPTKAGAKRA